VVSRSAPAGGASLELELLDVCSPD